MATKADFSPNGESEKKGKSVVAEACGSSKPQVKRVPEFVLNSERPSSAALSARASPESVVCERHARFLLFTLLFQRKFNTHPPDSETMGEIDRTEDRKSKR
ncbi:hypothetical protein RRG08_043555 [Elysia crispata]|uniref:Uncharacterized protein n=1 Tax=Elysia crispata TaxID=231223 RepID=A0AAE0YFF3_9GAST|nr:hypothetical protein RRG08_043555 [Elysia crispata]